MTESTYSFENNDEMQLQQSYIIESERLDQGKQIQQQQQEKFGSNSIMQTEYVQVTSYQKPLQEDNTQQQEESYSQLHQQQQKENNYYQQPQEVEERSLIQFQAENFQNQLNSEQQRFYPQSAESSNTLTSQNQIVALQALLVNQEAQINFLKGEVLIRHSNELKLHNQMFEVKKKAENDYKQLLATIIDFKQQNQKQPNQNIQNQQQQDKSQILQQKAIIDRLQNEIETQKNEIVRQKKEIENLNEQLQVQTQQNQKIALLNQETRKELSELQQEYQKAKNELEQREKLAQRQERGIVEINLRQDSQVESQFQDTQQKLEQQQNEENYTKKQDYFQSQSLMQQSGLENERSNAEPIQFEQYSYQLQQETKKENTQEENSEKGNQTIKLQSFENQTQQITSKASQEVKQVQEETKKEQDEMTIQPNPLECQNCNQQFAKGEMQQLQCSHNFCQNCLLGYFKNQGGEQLQNIEVEQARCLKCNQKMNQKQVISMVKEIKSKSLSQSKESIYRSSEKQKK